VVVPESLVYEILEPQLIGEDSGSRQQSELKQD
jgi:hypothetical protein